MSLTVTSVGANPQIPGFNAETFIPDQLIAGNLKLVTASITLAAGTLARGTVLGRVTASGAYVESVKTVQDGSEVPCAILADAADASVAPVETGAYLTGEFNANALTYDASWTLSALAQELRKFVIFVKSAVSAADPT